MKLEHSLIPNTKINSKWIRELHVRQDTIKLLEENIGRTPFDINHSKIFFDPPPRVMEIKTKINKWDLMRLQIFCTAKETINKTQRQPSEWEKIFANESTDKGLISKIYKQLMHVNIKKTNNPEKNNTITEMKNTLEGINNRITEAKGQISELEDKMVEITAE